MSELQCSLEDLCRLCAKFNIDAVPLFVNDGKSIELLEIIGKLLPFEINSFDGLPQKICGSCLACLETCKQFSNDCIKAHEKLKSIYVLLSNEAAQPEEPNSSDYYAPVFTEVSESPEKLTEPVLIEAEKPYSTCNRTYEDPIEINQSDDNKEFTHLATLSPDPQQKVSQPPSRSLLCDVCGKVFERANNLRVHRATHLQDDLKKKHVCSNCGKRFSSKFQLKEHENVHLGLKPHSCDLCDKKFHKRILLRQHKLTHLPESQLFECYKCGLRFNRKGNLKAHEKTHSSSRNFVCRVCSRPFGDMRSLLMHRRLDHTVKKPNESSASVTEHVCTICQKYFENAETLNLHIKTHEQKGNQQVACKICGQVLKTKALKYHEISKHSNNRPYQCSYCSDDSKVVGFMSIGLLKNHERLHTGQRPFKCDSCEKSFRSRKSLRQHTLKHSTQRKFACSFCSKRFKTNGTLKVHEKIHTGDKSYVCDRCGHPFIQKSDMLKHQRRHTDCDVMPNFSTELTSSAPQTSKEDFESVVKTVNVSAPSSTVVLPEQVQKMLTLTSTTILPMDTLIFAADQPLISQPVDSSLIIRTQSSSLCNEIRNENFAESRILESVPKQTIMHPSTSHILDRYDTAVSVLSTPLKMQASSDMSVTDVSVFTLDPQNSSSNTTR